MTDVHDLQKVDREQGIHIAFAGRERHIAVIEAPHVLVEVPEHNDPEGNDENLVIEGDNIDAMASLMAQFAGQVSVCLTDPPYGGNRKGLRYDDGDTGWLNQMMATFHLVHELLAETGVLFVHIDDDNLFTLGMLLDDIFGRENRLGVIVWKSATDNNPTRVAQEHEYILVFAKDAESCAKPWKGPIVGTKRTMLDEADRILREVEGVDAQRETWRTYLRLHRREFGALGGAYTLWDVRGPFMRDNMSWPGGGGPAYSVLHPVTGEPCKVPTGGWRIASPERMRELIDAGEIVFGPDETTLPTRKRYLAHSDTAKLPSVLLDFDARVASKEIARLFPEDPRVFRWPKPSALVEYLLSFVADKDALVLDPFAGSGTTAHGVMRLNSKDGGDRRFITVERGNLERNDGYAVELTATRIRRAREIDHLPGGFTFLRVGDELNPDAWARLRRDEVIRVIRQADPSGRGRGIRRIDGDHVIGANARKQAICLRWEADGEGIITREVLAEMFREVADLGLRLPMRVYGTTCEVAETEDFTFCQLPDEVRVLLGIEDRTERAA